MTNFADHKENLSHDQVNRCLRRSNLTPELLWEKVKYDIVHSENGYILFDDTVADKNFLIKYSKS